MRKSAIARILTGAGILTVSLLVNADDSSKASDGQADSGPKTLSGMSVLGNNEAPKSLVIVPWQSSQIGDGIGVVDSLNNRPMPIDRDVFARELGYYEIRSGSPNASDDAYSTSLKSHGR